MQRGYVRLASTGLAVLAGGGAIIAGVAAPAAAATPVRTAAVVRAAAAGCATGAYQKQVEGYLARLGTYGRVSVNGRQSAADCAAIKKFQKRFGIQPANGLAGPTTNNVAQRLVGTRTSACKASSKVVTVCVDLTHQTVWVMKGGKVTFGPTVTRTGMKGHRTPTGTYKINKKTPREWSDPYHVWMPYWERFVGGIGLHQTTTYLHDGWRGSHGCVNLLPADAKYLYGTLKVGTTVKVFGRRPGT